MSKKLKLAVLTTSRADFGLLKTFVRLAMVRFQVDLLVTGMHFLESGGRTITEVEQEFLECPSVNIVPFKVEGDVLRPGDQVRFLAKAQILASQWFDVHSYDALVFLGDRWELSGVTMVAFLYGIPLAHISGGEVTEGVIDESIRHAHSKLSHLHFVASEDYARNLSLMGEEDWRICVVGECGLDLVYGSERATLNELKTIYGLNQDKDLILVTFHASTLELDVSLEEQMSNLLSALKHFNTYQIIFTAPGVEQGSEIILKAIGDFVALNPNTQLIHHMGSKNYLGALAAAKVVVGNSSSGLVEAPSLGVPCVNIGLRQMSRLAADSVVHVPCKEKEIQLAIEQALSNEYQVHAKQCNNPYDPFRDGKGSLRIVNALERALNQYSSTELRHKKFDTEVRSEHWNALLKEGV
jgi:GDP/UDP-N,N'-diacetylbacillosamine 2-epimerase (hydrolysing)